MIVFELYEVPVWATEDATWDDFPYWKQRAITEEAYVEKDFRECTNHQWNLNIDFGSVNIDCTNCHADYSLYCGENDYAAELNGTIPLGDVKLYVDKDSYTGEVTDTWFEIS